MGKPKKHIKTKKLNMKNKTRRLRFNLKGGLRVPTLGTKNKTAKTIEEFSKKTEKEKLTDTEMEMLRKLGYRITQSMSNQTAEAIVKRALGISMKKDKEGKLQFRQGIVNRKKDIFDLVTSKVASDKLNDKLITNATESGKFNNRLQKLIGEYENKLKNLDSTIDEKLSKIVHAQSQSHPSARSKTELPQTTSPTGISNEKKNQSRKFLGPLLGLAGLVSGKTRKNNINPQTQKPQTATTQKPRARQTPPPATTPAATTQQPQQTPSPPATTPAATTQQTPPPPETTPATTTTQQQQQTQQPQTQGFNFDEICTRKKDELKQNLDLVINSKDRQVNINIRGLLRMTYDAKYMTPEQKNKLHSELNEILFDRYQKLEPEIKNNLDKNSIKFLVELLNKTGNYTYTTEKRDGDEHFVIHPLHPPQPEQVFESNENTCEDNLGKQQKRFNQHDVNELVNNTESRKSEISEFTPNQINELQNLMNEASSGVGSEHGSEFSFPESMSTTEANARFNK